MSDRKSREKRTLSPSTFGARKYRRVCVWEFEAVTPLMSTASPIVPSCQASPKDGVLDDLAVLNTCALDAVDLE
jgi:hypothetical protein